jgi:iron complex transport system substrate-binding protein
MKRILSLVLAMLMIISLTACNSNPSSTDKETKKIIDAAGDEVIIPAKVDTVINLVTYGCQVMVGLGFGDYLIGINVDAIESPWMAEMYPRTNEIEKFDQEASAEILLRANADVVLVQEAEQARDLRSKGVTAVTFSYWSLEDMKATIKMLGDILGGDAVEKCNKYIAYLDGNIALVSNTLKDNVLEKETLYYINGVSNKGLYKTAGKGSTNSACAQLSHTIFATDLLIESPANKVDSEAILSVNPQNIIIGGKYQHVLYDELMATSEWSNNTAVKNGHVFKVPMGISAWNRYGIEIALMITWTSAVVYPEYFEYDLVNETIDFYKEFTGITLTEQQAQYILEGLTPSGEKEITN